MAASTSIGAMRTACSQDAQPATDDLVAALAAHAGDIWVEDREGGGSVFRCRWPAR